MRVCPFGSYDWVCNEVERCFRCSDVDHANRHPMGDQPDCPECKLSTLQFSPTIRGQARNQIPPKGTDGRNSWENGFAIDHRGIPFRDGNTGAMIPVKKFAEKRSAYQESMRANKNGALVSK